MGLPDEIHNHTNKIPKQEGRNPPGTVACPEKPYYET
jgi:hypothetical protein